MNRRAYVTFVSTASYVIGAIALKLSLMLARSKVPLVALVTNDLAPSCVSDLKLFGIEIARLNGRLVNINLPDHYWRFTLEKLNVFSLCQFDKIIYIDSDILVLRNLDRLFERPHMSAVGRMRLPDGQEWNGLNSGLMVVSPEMALAKALLDCASEVAKLNSRFGDQDVIQYFYRRWQECHGLHLEEGYNVYIGSVDYYIKDLGYSLVDANKAIYCVHFIGPQKPWQVSFREQLAIKWKLTRKRQYYRLVLTIYYMFIGHLIRLILLVRAPFRSVS